MRDHDIEAASEKLLEFQRQVREGAHNNRLRSGCCPLEYIRPQGTGFPQLLKVVISTVYNPLGSPSQCVMATGDQFPPAAQRDD